MVAQVASRVDTQSASLGARLGLAVLGITPSLFEFRCRVDLRYSTGIHCGTASTFRILEIKDIAILEANYRSIVHKSLRAALPTPTSSSLLGFRKGRADVTAPNHSYFLRMEILQTRQEIDCYIFVLLSSTMMTIPHASIFKQPWNAGTLQSARSRRRTVFSRACRQQ